MKVIDLKAGVISTLGSISRRKEKIKRHKVLLIWIERQRRELINDSVSAQQKSSSRQSTRATFKVHLTATKSTKIDHPKQKRARQQKIMINLILDPVNPTRVFKIPKQSRKRNPRTSVLHNFSQADENINIDHSIAESRNNIVVPVNEMRARLRPIRSSRVPKSTSRRPTER